MDELERAVSMALTSLHPALGALYERGCAIARAPVAADTGMLLGHIGREILNATRRKIAQELPQGASRVPEAGPDEALDKARACLAEVLNLPPDDHRIAEALDTFGDSQALVIGRSLGLSPKHDVVRNWVGLSRALTSLTHFGSGRSGSESQLAIEDFHRLTNLLWARLAPYFDTETEIDALLRQNEPSDDDVNHLKVMFVRPRLRYYFFSKCNSAAWVERLEAAGFFQHPPDAEEDQFQTGRFTPWPEGNALINAAAAAPEVTVRILKANISAKNHNPLVWDQVWRVAELLPPANATSLVSLLVKCPSEFRHPYASYASLKVLSAAAQVSERSALRLAQHMLRLRPIPSADPARPYHQYSPPSHSLLRFLNEHQLDEFLDTLVVSVGTSCPFEVWSLLLDSLGRAMRLLARANYRSALESHYWLRRWTTSRANRDDLRAQLAVAADRIAAVVLKDYPEQYERYAESLSKREGSIFVRLRLRLMTAAGPASAGDAIDAVISDKESLDAEYGAREVAELLRLHFREASEAARQAFVANLEAGPPDEDIASWLEWHGSEASSGDKDEFVLRWQERRLRWFHEELPSELQPLAMRIGFVPGPIDRIQQDLDEVGSASGGAGWSGDKSPITSDELRSMSDDEVLKYLLEWQPSKSEQLDGPNKGGLAVCLQQMLQGSLHSRRALIAGLAESNDVSHRYQRAALAVCRADLKGADADCHLLPWSELISLIEAIIVRVPEAADAAQPILETRRTAIEAIRDACHEDQLPTEFRSRILSLVSAAVETSLLWSSLEKHDYPDFDAVVLAALNSDAGLIVDVVVATALWMRRADGEQLNTEMGTRVRKWIDCCSSREDVGMIPAHAQLGRMLPWVLSLAPGWFEANQEGLCSNGMKEPIESPFWGAFLVMDNFYKDTQIALRPWFARHAPGMSTLVRWEESCSTQSRDLLVSRGFVKHVGIDFLHGGIQRGDGDHILEQVFGHAHPDDRAHFSWMIMRGLQDAEHDIDAGYLGRLIEFWEWRLDMLAAASHPGDEKDLDALGWFILIPQLKPEDILPLAHRTISLAPRFRDVRRHVWKRLPELVTVDARRSMEMIEMLLGAELEDEYPFVSYSEVAPALSAVLASSEQSAQATARTVIHRLGEAGWSEFRKLLTLDQGRDKNH